MFLCRIAEDGRRQIQTNHIHSKKLSFYIIIASDQKISDNSQVFVVLWVKE
jgi:hypothetical protein